IRDEAIDHRRIPACDVAGDEHRRAHLFLVEKAAELGHALVNATPGVEKRRAVGLYVNGDKDRCLAHLVKISLSYCGLKGAVPPFAEKAPCPFLLAFQLFQYGKGVRPLFSTTSRKKPAIDDFVAIGDPIPIVHLETVGGGGSE